MAAVANRSGQRERCVRPFYSHGRCHHPWSPQSRQRTQQYRLLTSRWIHSFQWRVHSSLARNSPREEADRIRLFCRYAPCHHTSSPPFSSVPLYLHPHGLTVTFRTLTSGPTPPPDGTGQRPFRRHPAMDGGRKRQCHPHHHPICDPLGEGEEGQEAAAGAGKRQEEEAEGGGERGPREGREASREPAMAPQLWQCLDRRAQERDQEELRDARPRGRYQGRGRERGRECIRGWCDG